MIEKLISFFKLSANETQGNTPEGLCPNCWGEQEYNNTIRKMYVDKQIDINNKEANYAFIQDFMVKHLDGIKLIKTGSKMGCPICQT